MILNNSNQNLSSCGRTPLLKVNLLFRYPPKFSTFLMFSTNLSSTVFCTFFAASFQLATACLPASDFFVLVSEAFLSSFLVNVTWRLKWVSSTLAVTPSRLTLVDVAMTYAGLTLLRGTPLIAYGPVTRRLPEGRDFKAIALLPLWAPESKITTDPGWIDFLPVLGLGWVLLLFKCFFSSSAGYQVLLLFLSFLLGAPPRTILEYGCTEMVDRGLSRACTLM